ncbi:pitrilysin family protein [Novosphingobium sp. FKTRR1]|uniref:M16 family metallopeptidase n=1 Tax=Novosphingobium sp. FKTRR1 TaxID=2879118 RepID=UPI001CF08807|nr:M16 family metallopeptidase [Novosphingobium sp. FKTRR1]
MSVRRGPSGLVRRLCVLLAPTLLLSGCAAPQGHVASALKPAWAFAKSDLAPEPAWRFGTLPNGMRFIIRRNATPPGTALVRLDIDAGSLDERKAERGYAHFVEHMAFNGSTHVPEGEMVKLLERDGLAFGADTNAQTSFEQTTYKLDLPRADGKLLDTALMLMRETASELTITPAAVGRERGVVLSELRDNQGYQLANLKDQIAFLYPRATYPQRLPIGTVASLEAATPDGLRGFWARQYVPEKATVIVVGDFDPAAVESAIRARFADWQPARPAPRPDQGKVERKLRGRTDIWLDPALSERITASRHGPWQDEPDTIANRRTALLRQIGYGVINRRFLRVTRAVDPPFRGAGYGTGDVFRIGRTTNLVVDVQDGGWQRGLTAARAMLDQALAHGFTTEELAEQVANIRTSLENAAAGADTRGNGALVSAALALLHDDQVPTGPVAGLARFNAFAPSITPASVLAALKQEALPLAEPLLRFQGRTTPAGGAKAIRKAWDGAGGGTAAFTYEPVKGPFAYTDFGLPGTVAADTREPLFAIRTVRFANGVRLNLKRTALEKDRIAVRFALDGGELLSSKANPLAVELAGSLAAGGLGKHSQDDLQTLLAGRSVSLGFGTVGDVFAGGMTTTPRDLALQLQVLAALISDPGYRPEAEALYRQNVSNFFKRIDATPGLALNNALGRILSDGDPRFSVQPEGAYQSLSFAKLKAAIADRLAHGALEITLVGDLDEDAAIASVARTFGALPVREADFRAYAAERQRAFTARRGQIVVRHKGEADQATLRLVWPTADDSDPVLSATLELLQEVAGIEVLDSVREALGKAYSPGADSSQSRIWRGWGTFSLQAQVAVSEVAATRAALLQVVKALRDHPVDADVLARARAPMLEGIDNTLNTNGGWMGLAERAQSHPERLTRFRSARARLETLTAADIQAGARRFLAPDAAVEVLVLPEGAKPG